LYVVQWLCAGLALWRLAVVAPASQADEPPTAG